MCILNAADGGTSWMVKNINSNPRTMLTEILKLVSFKQWIQQQLTLYE